MKIIAFSDIHGCARAAIRGCAMTLTTEEILWCKERTCMNILLNFRLPELSPPQIKILKDYGLLKRDHERTLDYELTTKGIELLKRTWEGKPARSKTLGEILEDILGEPWYEFKQGVHADTEKLKHTIRKAKSAARART